MGFDFSLLVNIFTAWGRYLSVWHYIPITEIKVYIANLLCQTTHLSHIINKIIQQLIQNS